MSKTIIEKNLDFIFKDRITPLYLKAYTDYIALMLNEIEIAKIKENNITILLSISPGNVISNFAFPPNAIPTFGHIVIIEKNIFEFCGFSLEEKCAMILHEFGHILNNPTDQNQREFYADYYAKRLGFGNHLAKSLEKFNAKNLPYIGNETKQEIQLRIAELKKMEQEPLLGSKKELYIYENN